MADENSSIFNKRATEKLRSPDDLDKFVQVTNPSVWVVLVACVALLAGLLAWGVFGAVETSITTKGAVISTDGDQGSAKGMCFLTYDKLPEVSSGDDVVMGGVPMKVAEVRKVPLSADEAKRMTGSDYLHSVLVSEEWVYPVTFEGDVSGLAQNVPLEVKITVDRVAPLSLIFRNGA